MDNTALQQFINQKIDQIMAAPVYSMLPEDQKQTKRSEIEDQIQNMILDTLIDSLTDEQMMSLQGVDPASDEAPQKIMELAAQVPNFAETIEEKLNTFQPI